jgi:CRP-like cAMP-binding protein
MAKNSYHDHLRQVPLFAGLNDHELDEVGGAATELRFEAGRVLMKEGDPAHEMVVVLEGTIEVTRDGEHVADIGPGSFAGEMALLTRSHRNSTVRAKTDIVVLHLDGRSFAAVLEDVPGIALKMLPVVAARVTANSDHHTH